MKKMTYRLSRCSSIIKCVWVTMCYLHRLKKKKCTKLENKFNILCVGKKLNQ